MAEYAAHADHRRGDRARLRGGGGAGRSVGHTVEDWVTLAVFWGMARLRLPAVLHPLRAEQQPRLDRGDRDQLPGRGGLPRLGHVRAHVAPHPGRRALPLSAARRSARVLSTAGRSHPHRLLRLRLLAALALRRASSRSERMVTVNLPRVIVFYSRVRRLRADVRARHPGLRGQLAAAATPCLERPEDFDGSGSLTMLLLDRLLPRPDADRRAGRDVDGWPRRCSTCLSTASRPTSSPRSA